jgi:hypothetical protein
MNANPRQVVFGTGAVGLATMHALEQALADTLASYRGRPG